MDINDFDDQCIPGKIPLDSRDITFWGCGLGGECGEVLNVAKKIDRDGATVEHEAHLIEEAGDTLFYLRQVLRKQGLTLTDAAEFCLAKLERQRTEAVI